MRDPGTPFLAIKSRECTTNTSAGAFFKQNETNSFKGREKCSSNCGGNKKKTLNIAIKTWNYQVSSRK